MDLYQKRAGKKRETRIAAVIMIAAMSLYILLFVWLCILDPAPLPVLLLFTIGPVIAIVGIVIAWRQREREIDGGEEDEAAKY